MHSVAADLNCRSGHEANVEIISKVMNIVVHPQRFEILGRGVCSSSTPSVYIINLRDQANRLCFVKVVPYPKRTFFRRRAGLRSTVAAPLDQILFIRSSSFSLVRVSTF